MTSKNFLTDKELYDILANSDSEDEYFGLRNHENESEISSESENEENQNGLCVLGDIEPDLGDQSSSSEDSSEPVQPKKRRTLHDKSDFNWRKIDLQPILHDFDNVNSGCLLQSLSDDPTPLEIFENFMSLDFINEIVTQSNLYFDFLAQTNPAIVKNHKKVTADEMYVFFSIALLMPLVYKQNVKDYWSKDIIIDTPIFGQLMSRGRFLDILRYLHFSDSGNVNPEDKLFKIRMAVNHFRNAFKKCLYPFQNIVIDESLLLFKGRISFRQYIPSKRHRFGVKFFVMVDCETGYILDFIIYTGASTEIKVIDDELGISGNVVMTLTEPYWDKGHRLYTDNWYSSPLLFDALHKRKTNCCGTVKTNRRFMPKFEKNLERGKTDFFSTDRLLALKWKDKRDVTMLTSIHNSVMGTVKNRFDVEIQKPVCVTDYNQNMGGVDKTDMLLSTTESVRKSIKWYKKVFFHFVDLSIVNSHVIYKMKTGKNTPLLQFQKDLVRQLVAKYQKIKPRSSTSRRPDYAHSPLRLIERHFPSMFPRKENNKVTVKRCVVCAKQGKRREISYCCEPCGNIPLCVIGCFERYHKVLKF